MVVAAAAAAAEEEEEERVLTRVVPNGTEGTERPRARVAVARFENASLLSPPFHFRKSEMRARRAV